MAFVLSAIPSLSWAQSSQGFTFQGRITKPDTTLLTESGLTVNVKILSPNDCVLWDENHGSVTVTDGYLNLIVGKGTPASQQPVGASFQKMADNTATPKTGLVCLNPDGSVNGGLNSYTPAASDARKVRVSMTLANLDQIAVVFSLRSVPFAVNAENLSGKVADDFVQTSADITQTRVASVYSRYSTLNNLLNGTYAGLGTAATKDVGVASGVAPLDAGSHVPLVNLGSGTASGTTYLRGDGTWATLPTATAPDWADITNKPTTFAPSAHSHNASDITAGTLSIARGGTGISAIGNSQIIMSKSDGSALEGFAKCADGEVLGVTSGAWDCVTPSGGGTDNTKLPLDGSGTMAGDLKLGGFDVLNAGHISQNAQKTLRVGSFTDTQQTALVASPLASGHQGSLWWNADRKALSLWDGAGVQEITGAAAPGSGQDGQSLRWNNTSKKWEYFTAGASGSGIATINGLGDSAQSLAVNTSGTSLTWAHGSATHTLSIPMADQGGVAAGLISKAQYDAFNGKMDVPSGTDGHFLKRVSGAWTSALIDIGDIKNSAGNSTFDFSACGAGKTVKWSSVPDKVECQDISITKSQVSDFPTLGTLSGMSPTGTASNTTYLRGDGAWAALPTATAPDWADITNKPTTFAPSAHTHAVDEITSASGKYFTYKPDNTVCADGQVLKWGNARWECGNDDASGGGGGGITDLTGDVTASGTGSVTATIATDAVVSSKIKDGNVTGAKLEDVSGMTANSFGSGTAIPVITTDTKGRITAISTTAVTGTLPAGSTGRFLKYDSSWGASLIDIGDIKNSAGNSTFDFTGCAPGKTLKWQTVPDRVTCEDISITKSQVSDLGTIGSLAAKNSIDLSTTDATGILTVAKGGTGTSNGSITGTGALTFAAGGTNQNITLTPSGTGNTILNGNVGVGAPTPSFALSVGDGVVKDGSILAVGYGTAGVDGQTLTAAGAGTRLIWYPKKVAFRAGTVTGTQWDDANIGLGSFSFGIDSIASGVMSLSMGSGAKATGTRAIAIGELTDASGESSFALGSGSAASGVGAMSLGATTTASSFVQTTLGRYNKLKGSENATAWSATDPLLVVGNGQTNLALSNALMILKNGNMGVGVDNPAVKLDVAGTIRAEQICDEAGNNCHDISTGWSSGGITALTGDVTASGTGSVAATLATVSGMTNNSFGSGTAIPVITTDTKGRITAISTTSVTGTLPSGTSGHFLKSGGGSSWSSSTIQFSDIKNSLGGSAFNTGSCVANQTVKWSALTDKFECLDINLLDADKITTGTINAARLPAAAIVPSQSGQSGKFLATNGTTASWENVTSTPSGLTTQVQYNNAGAMGASSDFTWDNANKVLNVNGQVRTKDHSQATGAIDWNNGNAIVTSFDCGSSISFANLRAGGAYTLVVTGTGTTKCSFARAVTGADAATLTYYWTPANAERTANTTTVYSLVRTGNMVLIAWVPGLVNDPCDGAGIGAACDGTTAIAAGTFNNLNYMTTPGNCANSTLNPSCPGTTDSVTKAWDSGSNGVTGATSTTDGKANWTAVSGFTPANFAAAKYCEDLVYGGYSDWYLPAKDELNFLYGNRVALGGFANALYYSSTESSGTNAHVQNMSTGAVSTPSRSTARLYRCVRSY
ncbi:MAG: DUF1566 domain-containing protein [Bdellovibrionaceae bacterium]|nr:DUF1566 domain-containing protein [Pseudobdellovibrionaceae bacterium]